MQREIESKDQHIQKDREAFEKESLKRKHLTRGLLSATFNLDSHNQLLEDAVREIKKLSRWYEKAMQDKKEMEENLRAQIQSLAQASLDQEEKMQYLTMRFQDIQESDVGECLKRMSAKRLLARKTDEYEQVCHELEVLRKNFLIQRRLYTELRAGKLYWEEQYAKIAKAGNDNHKIIPDLYQEYRFYKDTHARLAFLANNIIGDMPRSLRCRKCDGPSPKRC